VGDILSDKTISEP